MPTVASWESHGFLRVAVVSPDLVVAHLEHNTRSLIAACERAAQDGARIVVTPELGVTGYTIGDLFTQQVVITAAWDAVHSIAANLAHHDSIFVVGLPVRATDARLYNCAAVVCHGEVRALVPKQYLPNRAEFYEDRWFSRALDRTLPHEHRGIPFGTDLVIGFGDHVSIGIEICEDLWGPQPPSGRLALAGANVIANPSSSPEALGKSEYRRDLVRQQSARCLAAYLYAGSGPGESTTDLVFGGHSLICENGVVLAETNRFRFDTQIAVADIDLMVLAHERNTNSSFSAGSAPSVRRIQITPRGPNSAHGALRRRIEPTPFVPTSHEDRDRNCEEIFSIQATGLAKRIRHTQSRTAIIGISGGLDSTLALLVAARSMQILQRPLSDVIAVTMPGFGTTDRTYTNALALMRGLGATVREIPIAEAVSAHFDDIGHDPASHDVVYENAQARERTQILMDLGNELGGLVVGTGDLSEAALGWMTFNGDHMSMYHVNAGVPKTLVRHLVSWAAEQSYFATVSATLHDIVDTPITPELLPLRDGALVQHTEEIVGPYDLHDFFLFHTVRYGSAPSRVVALAEIAFAGRHDRPTIIRWLEVFLRRFFSQQFKRSSMPDGPKVGSVALSPRGDWRMPSDASSASWLAELEAISRAGA